MSEARPPGGRTPAEAAFFEYLDLRKAGAAPDFEEWCAARPDLAAALRKLHESWRDIEPLLQSLWEANPELSLTDVLGAGPGPALPDAAPAGPAPPSEPAPSENAGLEAGLGALLSLPLEGGGPRDRGALEALLERIAGWAGSPSRYRMLGALGHGGMGTILKVWDEALRRHLAMKLVGSPADSNGTTAAAESAGAPASAAEAGSAERSADPGGGATSELALARFLDEALVTGQLDHPGIVPVHELGVDRAGRVYFTMKLVKGDNLRTIFDKLHAGEDGWTVNRAVGVILRVCEAVAYAHSKRVIHRDIKPANVMVGRFGET
jgi:hypothetical protein